MASLLLRRALFSVSKSLFVSMNPLSFSSVAFRACTLYTIPKNIMAFRSSLFLTSNHLLPAQHISGLKTKSVLKKRCKDCYMVKRRGRLYIYCKSNGKHKQRQG